MKAVRDYKYNSWKLVPRKMVTSFVKSILGIFVLFGLLKKKEKTHYVVLPPMLGDSIQALSYMEEFKRQRNIPHVTVVCTPYVARLCDYYKNTIDTIICKKKWKIMSLCEGVNTIIGEHITLWNDRLFTFVHVPCNVKRRVFWGNTALTFSAYIKLIVYKIDLSSEWRAPQIPFVDISETIREYGLLENRTAYLSPYSNSGQAEIKGILEKLVEYFRSKGYKVVTLTANDAQSPVCGTQAIQCSLEEAFHLVRFGGLLLGQRSGFLDVMAFAGGKLIAIVDKEYGLKDIFDIEKTGVNPKCHTVIYNGNDEDALQQILMFSGENSPLQVNFAGKGDNNGHRENQDSIEKQQDFWPTV